MEPMRAGRLWLIAAAASLAVAFAAGALAWVGFSSALSARLDRARDLEAAAVRPAAAARLAATLLEHRLTLVSEEASRQAAAAFSRAPSAPALEAYRLAGGSAATLASAARALAASSSNDADGEIAFLRTIRVLRQEAASSPRPGRPDPPASAGSAGVRLLWAGGFSALAALFAFCARRAARTTA